MKRKSSGLTNAKSCKRQKQDHDGSSNRKFNHSLLSKYYRKLYTLREFIIQRLSERVKSKRIAKLIHFLQRKPENGELEDKHFHHFLDSVIVCHGEHVRWSEEIVLKRDIVAFTQACPGSVTSTLGQDCIPDDDLQKEVVNYVIWSLFRSFGSSRNEHLLCQGFTSASSTNYSHTGFRGIVCQFPNSHVETLTNQYWCRLLITLGIGGELLMADLLLRCSIFMPTDPVDGRVRGNYYQLSGLPLSTTAKFVKFPRDSESEACKKSYQGRIGDSKSRDDLPVPRTLSEIRFVRNRIFYSRPTFNSKGIVRLGLRHVHVLNRYTDLENQEESIHIAKYVFPRQFGLHNVFTSSVDSRETTQPFKDYTLREREIEQVANKSKVNSRLKLPKRLRGSPIDLVCKIRQRHGQISYVELLKHYCPIDENAWDGFNQSTQSDLINTFSTASSDCAAFVKAVLNKLIPFELWGDGEDGNYNQSIILGAAELFVRRRKFESLTLHDVVQNIKVASIPWLRPPNVSSKNMSKTDFQKRKELLTEFVYWLFDSFIIPLIRSNFHVTESNKDKNRLYFFRLDLWHQLTTPAFQKVRNDMYEEIKTDAVKKLLSLRKLGYSNLRLLPKSNSFRPIMNLRRRPEYIQYGKRLLGQSINSLLNPVYKALHYEAFRDTRTLGSSLLSVSSIHKSLKTFKASLISKKLMNEPLYFAKVDVKSCFDSLPQEKVLSIAHSLLSTSKYAMTKYAEVSEPHLLNQQSKKPILKHRIRYLTKSHSTKRITRSSTDASERLDDHNRKNTVYISPLNRQVQSRESIYNLLREHIERNVVKIGKKFYRQKRGIPQGSVVSSLLCSLVYTHLEQSRLAFIEDSGCSVLLRLIDDFLVISSDQSVVTRILDVMAKGIEEFGVEVKKEKSLVNFDVSLGGTLIPKLDGTEFPYCGILINTKTLNVSKEISNLSRSSINNSLTVSWTNPGNTFKQKALNALPIHLHAMFYDTDHNSLKSVLVNVYRTFLHAAKRTIGYLSSLRNEISKDIVTGTFSSLKSTKKETRCDHDHEKIHIQKFKILPRSNPSQCKFKPYNHHREPLRLCSTLLYYTILDSAAPQQGSPKTNEMNSGTILEMITQVYSIICTKIVRWKISRDQVSWLACKAFWEVSFGRHCLKEIVGWLEEMMLKFWPDGIKEGKILGDCVYEGLL